MAIGMGEDEGSLARLAAEESKGTDCSEKAPSGRAIITNS